MVVRGTGEIQIALLDTGRLDVRLPGAVAVRAAGRATEQTITSNF